jgi:hypothetical protein
MSIEQKIAAILAESKQLDEAKFAGKEGGTDSGKDGAVAADKAVVRQGNPVPNGGETPNPDNARNNVQDEKQAENAPAGSMNPNNGDQSAIRQGTTVKGVKEDIDALLNGEELSEDFRAKAETIFEAAVMTRVKAELARIEEEFESKLAEQVAKNTEGLVEQVDGYLGYVAEQWMTQNELALERGMKSEILEGFVSGLKDLFEEHYIDIPEEKFDVLGSLEEQVEELEAKLNEQVAANIELSKTLAEQKKVDIVKSISEGLTDTETEKFNALVEELSFEDASSFETKVKTIRENYFTTKTTTVQSVVTDAPVALTEEVTKKVSDPAMSAYAAALDKINK